MSNILLIASTDSYNQYLLEIAEKLQKIGKNVLILLTHKEKEHNYMVMSDKVKYKYWFEFDEYEKYEVVIYGNILNKEVLNKVLKVDNLRIGLFFHLVPNRYVLGGANLNAHFTLCFGKQFSKSQTKNGIKHNILPIGIPFKNIQKKDKKTKKILFLEQHFYPSGKKGKKELANFLIKLANLKKEYKIIVKPRALENEKNPKHKAEHIYKYLTKIPKNLILLKKHYPLEKLIDNSDIVMTTFSTAIVPAILKNKKVVFVKGFSMLETYYYNKKIVEDYYLLHKKSGVVVDYKELLKNLKIKKAKISYKNDLFFDRKSDFFDSLIEFIEYAQKYKNIKVKNCNIDNYKLKFKQFSKKLKQQNIFNNIVLEQFYRVNLISSFRLDKEYKLLRKELKKLKKQNISNYKKEAENIKQKYVEQGLKRILKNYKQFSIGFKGFYLKFLFNQNRIDEFKNLPKDWHIADYYYYLYLENKKEKYLKKYLNIVVKAQYRFTPVYENDMIQKYKKILQNRR